MALLSDPSPGESTDCEERIQRVIDFWNALYVGGQSGETAWAVLDEIQAEVTDCLNRENKRIARAESLTFKAGLLISGQVIA